MLLPLVTNLKSLKVHSMHTPVLDIDHVSFSYTNKPLLKAVSISVRPGEVIYLTGGNGAGKSTLLALIAGLTRPQQGSITIQPNPTEAFSQSTWMDYLAAENNALFTGLNATENMRFWLDLADSPKQGDRIDHCLRHWGFKKKLLRERIAVGKFSTGMKRRLALARIELTGARYLLLDEPTNGLNSEGCQLFRKFLHSHKASGGSAIIVSHDKKVLENLYDYEYSLHPTAT